MVNRIITLFLALFAALALQTPAHAQAPNPYDPAREIVADIGRVVAPNGIEETRAVRLGGMDQWITIRGADRRNPVLLYVHGGPGATEMAGAWAYQRTWEDYFTVVNWDQRGAGRTFRAAGEEATRATLTRARMTEDAIELIAFLREHLQQEKIIVLGHSWGNVVGLSAALARPDWIAAYVGMGPLLDMQENERVSYERVLAIARQRNDQTAIAELEALAPYPGDLTLARLEAQRKWVAAYGGLSAYRQNGDQFYRARRLSPLYDAEDRAALNAGGLLSITLLASELQAVDFTSVRRTPFPVLMFVGRHDLTTPPEITELWLRNLRAPSKRLIWFEHAAHLPMIEEPGRTLAALLEHVRPLAIAD